MTLLNKKILFFFILFAPMMLWSQDYKVFRGILKDSETGYPIRDVHAYSTSHHTDVSDFNGYFELYVSDNDTIHLSSVNYGKSDIYVASCGQYYDKVLVFELKPVVYVLREVVVPLTQSVVILPVEKKEKVDVQGVEKGTREIPKVKLDDNVDLVWKRETYNQGLDYFGMGITIKGFISGLFNSNENKSEKKIEELERIEKGTETFYNYIRSADFKNVMTNDYGLTEDEFVDFVNYFQKNAGSIRKSTNEYDILKSAVGKVSSFKNTYIKNK